LRPSEVVRSGEVDAVHDVAPLVGATHLEEAALAAVELEEVVGLEDHVVELEKRQRLLAVEARLHALEGEHAVDREVAADVAEELEIVEPVEPFGVVQHDRLPGRVVEVLGEDAADRRDVRRDLGGREQRALVGAERGIADLGRAAAHQRDRPVAGLLQPAQHHDVEQMADVERLGGGVVADVGGHDTGQKLRIEGGEVGAVLQVAARDHHVEEIALRARGHGSGPFAETRAVL
jgi:hypothetical protein